MTITTTTASDYPESVGIMYPVDWPTDDPKAHCTLFYLGEIPDVQFTPEDLLDAIDEAGLTAPGPTYTIGLEFFGENKDVPVVQLDSLEARLQKIVLKHILLSKGIEDASSFPDYKPHVTIQSPDMEIPDIITLHAPQVWWGTERLTRSE